MNDVIGIIIIVGVIIFFTALSVGLSILRFKLTNKFTNMFMEKYAQRQNRANPQNQTNLSEMYGNYGGQCQQGGYNPQHSGSPYSPGGYQAPLHVGQYSPGGYQQTSQGGYHSPGGYQTQLSPGGYHSPFGF